MRAADVLFELVTDQRLSRCEPAYELALSALAFVLGHVKPEQESMPLSPTDVATVRIALRALLDAFDVAKARRPVHLEAVGGSADSSRRVAT